MNVLQINVRLQEGGAARIALDLHRRLLDEGVESRFAYGWGENGGKSSAEATVPHSFQVGIQIQIASNLLSHSMVGFDYLQPFGIGRIKLKAAIQMADIVHLHVIHSYFLPISWFLKELLDAGKPIVWTAHDYWMITGRCAFTEGCELWRNGCGKCPTQNNYPPALIDFSASQFKIKRLLLAELSQRLHVVTPSEFVAQAISEGLPDVEVRVISNWIDSEFEAALQALPLSNLPINISSSHVVKVIVIANDLSDSTKVDRKLVGLLLDMPHIEIHTIGQYSPFTKGRVVNHGRIENRTLMVEIIASANVALFTSEKDTFGLVMIEALACGVPVMAVDSLAANEVLPKVGIHSTGSRNDIVKLLQDALLPKCYYGMSSISLRDNVLRVFSGKVGIEQYMFSYANALVGRRDK